MYHIMYLSQPSNLYNTKYELECLQILKDELGIPSWKSDVTGQSNRFTNIWNNVTEGWRVDADLTNSGNKWVYKNIDKVTTYKYCVLVNENIPHRSANQNF